MTVAPYGSWRSPISADALASVGHPVGGGGYVGDDIWWSELRPDQGGRYAVRRAAAGGGAEDVLPPPWNARSRVHEYGGGAWTADDRGLLVFAEFTDQRLYRLDEPGGTPVAITPEPPAPGAWRYGDLQLRGEDVWCVRERHAADGSLARDIAVVPLSGGEPRSIVSGSHFLAYPRPSADGTMLAWIAWEHPQMPWDGTELRVADLVDGAAGPSRTLLGSVTESVLQPEWRDGETLYALTDRSGFWNLVTVLAVGGEASPVAPVAAEIGGPLWSLGTRWYSLRPDGSLLTVRRFGTDTLALLDPASGEYRDLDLGAHAAIGLSGGHGDTVLLTTGGAGVPSGLRELDLPTGRLRDVRLGLDVEALPAPGYLPEAEQHTFTGRSGPEVHAVVYRPRNPDYEAPAGELPPFVALVHGGPTSSVTPSLSLQVAYYTSRGIGVVDVNYGGSTGYGREYRDRLLGQWGVVDVEDTVAAVEGLAAAGIADPARLAIEGGSAGGWTVLSALTASDVFACGISYYGVAELLQFAQETHDFESRYLDGLIGPLPEARELYEQRAPLNNVDGLSCPVLLLQGLDDPIVPPSQAERFRDALVAKGLPYAYRAYAGESHGFRRHETIVDSLQAALSFLGQVMGFVPPGVPELALGRP